MHGGLRQQKRERVLQAFRNRRSRIIVATDVAARGIDVPHIQHVINYDLPECPEDYIHRIGRTGRAGAQGSALSFVSPQDNHKWRSIYKLMNMQKNPDFAHLAPQGKDTPGDANARSGYNGSRNRNRSGQSRFGRSASDRFDSPRFSKDRAESGERSTSSFSEDRQSRFKSRHSTGNGGSRFGSRFGRSKQRSDRFN
jgi:superfamily II DNA/RNA helicase